MVCANLHIMKQAINLLVVSGLIFFTSCGNLKEPDFKGIDNVRMDRIGAKESIVFLDINYYNPNKAKLKLKEARGDAWLEGTPLGHFTIDSAITIPPLSDFSLPVKLQVDMSKAAKNTMTLLLNPIVNVRIEGKAKVGKSGFFIKYPITYEGKHDFSGMLKY